MRLTLYMIPPLLWMGIALAAERPADLVEMRLFPPELVMQNRADIGLTDEQAENIRAHVEQVQTDAADRQNTVVEATGKLAKLLEASRIDEAAALKQLDEVLAAEREMRRFHLRVMIRVKRELTAEQQQKLVAKARHVPPPEDLRQRLESRLARIEKETQRRAEAGQPPLEAMELMRSFPEHMQAGRHKEAEALLDKVLKMLGLDEAKDQGRPRKEEGATHGSTNPATGAKLGSGSADARKQTGLAPGVLAFGERVGDTSQIFTCLPDGSQKRQLTRGSSHCWFPAISPDGTNIAYVHEPQIWVMQTDGKNQRPLIKDGFNIAPAWSPDGGRIAYAHKELEAQGGLKIWLVDADGKSAYRLTKGADAAIDENVARWSPDGSKIVFTSNRNKGRYEIWLADAKTGEVLRSLTKAYRDEQLQADIEQKVPAWSPDGSMIAYWSGVEAHDPRPELPRDVWIMRADGSNQRCLAAGDDPNWSPDGKAIIFSRIQRTGPELAAINPDGSNLRSLFRVNARRPLQSSWGHAAGIQAEDRDNSNQPTGKRGDSATNVGQSDWTPDQRLSTGPGEPWAAIAGDFVVSSAALVPESGDVGDAPEKKTKWFTGNMHVNAW